MSFAGTKVTFFFDQQGYGWTESYYTGTLIGSSAGTFGPANSLLRLRLKCAGAQTSVTFVRVMDLAGKRLGYTYRPPTAASGNPDKESDAPATAALIKRRGGGFRRQSQWFMRGNWDDACARGGLLNPDSLWQTQALQPFLAELAASRWGWAAKDLTSPLPSVVATLVPNVSGQLVITTANAIFAPQNLPSPAWGWRAKVSLSGLVGATTANGVWVVTVQSPTQCTTVRQILVNNYAPGSGRLNYTFPTIITIEEAEFQRFVERKPGRPLYHSAGRWKGKKVTW